jgi:signal transduction histidine kinase
MCGIATKQSEDAAANESMLLRQELAEQLHDGPLQELVALQLKAGNLARLGAASIADQQERLTELGELAQQAIEQLHAVIRDLVAEPGEKVELFARVVELCEQFRATTGLYCVMHLEPAHFELAPEIGEVVYRGVRELLANVRKHAEATEVVVRSHHRSDDAIVVTVTDNGIGTAPRKPHRNPSHGGGFGLWSIEHRLHELGASLEINGEDGLRAEIVLPKHVAGRR